MAENTDSNTYETKPAAPSFNIGAASDGRGAYGHALPSHADHHVVNIPLTPRVIERHLVVDAVTTSRSDLYDSPATGDVSGYADYEDLQRLTSRHRLEKSHKKKKKRKSRSRERPDLDQGNDVHINPVVPINGTRQPLPVLPPTPPAQRPAIESPDEPRLAVIRHRSGRTKLKKYAEFDDEELTESGDEEPKSAPQSKTFRTNKRRKKCVERDNEVPLVEDGMRDYVQTKFHQKIPLDITDYGSKHSQRPGEDGFRHIATKAFGRINFKKDAKSSYEPPYLCLSSSDDKEDLLRLMSDYWQLPDPKLIVSIVGGAKRFQFAKNRISGLFKRGLLDIATTTGAWILTPGSNTGVYKMVGSAVKDHIDATGSAAMNNIVLLGIASWGSVADRERLEGEKGQFPAQYPISEIVVGKKKIQPLDPNHSHFILVDDGSRDKFGGEIKWRAEFEKFLMDHVLSGTETENKEGETDEVNIPLVTLLVNGGDGSLEACSESLKINIPLVSIAGSGRAAEVIVLIHKLFQTKAKDNKDWRPSKDDLRTLYGKAMSSQPKEEVMGWLEIISDHHNHISVFDFTHSSVESDDIGLDRAILSALYRGEKMDISKRKAQMKLALSWNRVDYARDVILNINNSDYKAFINEKSFLYHVAFDALVDDMEEFLTLFLDHGLDLREFVTKDCLEKLYKKCMQRDEAYSRFANSMFESTQKSKGNMCTKQCRNSIASEDEYMYQIGRLFKTLLGYSYPNIYRNNSESDVFSEDPAKHLFLWAILFNRMEMAKLFWKYSRDHIAGAIVGAGLLRNLAQRSNHQEGVDITISYQENSMKFEGLANGILDCCWAKDRQYTSIMLVREAPNWGNSTALSLAYNVEMEEFLAQPACYTKLNKIWRGDIALRTHIAWIVIFAIMPLAAFALKFVRKSDDAPRLDEQQNDPVDLEDLSVTGSEHPADEAFRVTYKPVIGVTLAGKTDHEISYLNAIYRAWRSPIVKCIQYSLRFVIFLAIYSLFLMTELRPYENALSNVSASINSTVCTTCLASQPTVGTLEIATYFFALANILEELRQMLFRDSRSLKYIGQKFADWFTDFWNKVDILSHVTFIVAICVRFTVHAERFEATRWLYCFSLLVYFVRFSQVFYVVEQLGPKIIMIRKMMVDLLFFIIILSMIILAFGVISHSILQPESPLDSTLFNNIIYRPYFQMYGELFLEDFGTGPEWILLGFYMIVTNILLLNLLIAMFSYTFQQVQEKSEILWKYNYYAVVYEHFDRPHVPLFGTLYQMIQSTACRDSKNTDFKNKLDDDMNRKITKFVKVCMEKYMTQQSKLLNENISHKVSGTARRLELVIEQLDDLRDDIIVQQAEFASSQELSSQIPAVGSGVSSESGNERSVEMRLKNLELGLDTKLDKLSRVESKLDRMLDIVTRQHQSVGDY